VFELDEIRERLERTREHVDDCLEDVRAELRRLEAAAREQRAHLLLTT